VCVPPRPQVKNPRPEITDTPGTTGVTLVSRNQRPALPRRLRIAALATASFILVALAGIHINAQIFRFRVGRILSVLKSYQLEETPASVVLKLRSDYRSHVFDKGTCTEQSCEFAITLVEWNSLQTLNVHHAWADRPVYYLLRGLRFFGLRIFYFDAELRVRDGKLGAINLWFLPSNIEFGSSDRPGFLSGFIITVDTVGNFRQAAGSPLLYAHPGIVVWRPSACTGCSGSIHISVTWQATRQEYESALDLNLSCITGFRDCRSVEEFVPSAAEIRKRDADESAGKQWGKIPCDLRAAEILGRDSDFIDVARIKRVRAGENNQLVVDYDVVRRLKGKELSEYHTSYSPNAQTNMPPPQIGEARLLFMNEVLGKPSEWSNCAVMPSTPENVEAVSKGIASDRSRALSN
jgi:hypothetical protein